MTCVVPVDEGDGDADDCDAVAVVTGTATSKLLLVVVAAIVAVTAVPVDDASASCDATDCGGGALLLFFTTNLCMMPFHALHFLFSSFFFHTVFHLKFNDVPLDHHREPATQIDGFYLNYSVFYRYTPRTQIV